VRIGILGGSFDPVHAGHVGLAVAARERLRLDRVLLVPAASQPLKPRGAVAPAEDRYAMVLLAVRGRPGIEASDLELRRAGPSYTVDTLREVRRGLEPGDALLLLLGADALRDFPRWREAAAIPALAEVVAFPRPGVRPPRLPAGIRAERVETQDVSSTEVRRRVAAGKGVEDLVGPEVAAYIAVRGLYRRGPRRRRSSV